MSKNDLSTSHPEMSVREAMLIAKSWSEKDPGALQEAKLSTAISVAKILAEHITELQNRNATHFKSSVFCARIGAVIRSGADDEQLGSQARLHYEARKAEES